MHIPSYPTIVLIHGMWFTEKCWENYINFFKRQGFDVKTVKLLYHDDSNNRLVGNLSLLEYVEDIEKQIDLITDNDDPLVLVGHSMGGLLAQMLIARRPFRYKAAALLAPAAPAGIYSLYPSTLRTFVSMLLTKSFWAKAHKPTLYEACYGVLNELSPEKQIEQYRMFCYESGRATCEIAFWYIEWIVRFFRKPVSFVDFGKVTIPLLFVGGGKDRLVKANVVRKIAKRYTNIPNRYPNNYLYLPLFGHFIIIEERWESVAEIISDFFNSHLN